MSRRRKVSLWEELILIVVKMMFFPVYVPIQLLKAHEKYLKKQRRKKKIRFY